MELKLLEQLEMINTLKRVLHKKRQDEWTTQVVNIVDDDDVAAPSSRFR